MSPRPGGRRSTRQAASPPDHTAPAEGGFSAPVDPRRESSADVWRRWQRDASAREVEAHVALEAHNAALTGPIYERELGAAIATATATMIPDWRLLRTEHPGWIRKLVAAQPESHVREAQQYGPLLRMISDHLPGHIRAMVPDLEAIIELRTLAREASAFLIGCEVGRCQAQRRLDDRGRLRRPGTAEVPEPAGFRLRLDGGGR